MRIDDTRHSNFAFALPLKRRATIPLEIKLFDRLFYSKFSPPDFLSKEKSTKKRSLIAMATFLVCFPLGAQAGQNSAATHDQASDARKASRQPAFWAESAVMAGRLLRTR